MSGRWGFLPWIIGLAFLLPAGPRPAAAAEFASPPGMNVAMQEDLLRERVSRIVKDLVGDKAQDVIVHIGYVRAQKPQGAGATDRIKLPGLNNYISASGGDGEVVPEFIRLRQVLIVVSNELVDRIRSLERDVRRQAELDAAKGDWVQVVPVAAVGSDQLPRGGKPGDGSAGKPKTDGAEKSPEKQADEPRRDAMAFKATEEPSREAHSTTYLVAARAAYFKGDYNTALDQILQSIREKQDNPQAFAMLGSLYYAMSWKSLALKYWEKSLALDPGNRELEGLVTQLRLENN
jgi:hypothetical protein